MRAYGELFDFFLRFVAQIDKNSSRVPSIHMPSCQYFHFGTLFVALYVKILNCIFSLLDIVGPVLPDDLQPYIMVLRLIGFLVDNTVKLTNKRKEALMRKFIEARHSLYISFKKLGVLEIV